MELIASGKSPLALDSPIILAPGIWAPGSPLPLDGLGALTTPLLGWEWDGGPQPFETRPGAFCWTPPRRPVDRFLKRLEHEHHTLPWVVAVAADEPRAIREAVRYVEERLEAHAYLIWWRPGLDYPAALAAAREETLLPLLADVPADLAPVLAEPVGTGPASAIIVGPPRAHGAGGRIERLWGPALLPSIELALHTLAPVGRPLLTSTGVVGLEDARRLVALGASGIALGPEWWTLPELARQLAPAFG